MEDVKQPSEADMMCTIDEDTFFLFMKNMWIGDSSDNHTSLFDIIDINESIQEKSGIMPAKKKTSYMSTSDKFMGLRGFTLSGP